MPLWYVLVIHTLTLDFLSNNNKYNYYVQRILFAVKSYLQLRNSKNAIKLRSKRNKVRTKKEVKKSDLVHVNKSPNFCKHNPKKGIPGTKDRPCNKSSQDTDSCSSLCCGRGYDTQVEAF